MRNPLRHAIGGRSNLVGPYDVSSTNFVSEYGNWQF